MLETLIWLTIFTVSLAGAFFSFVFYSLSYEMSFTIAFIGGSVTTLLMMGVNKMFIGLFAKTEQ
jgi:hypothetical protein